MAGVPMVVTYRVNALTAAIARRLFTVRYASLVNLLAEREVVPELVQQACTPDRLAAALGRLLTEPTEVAQQRAGFRETLALLRAPEGAPSEAAAMAVLQAATVTPSGATGTKQARS
jgi:lipid-A-disaccharide synthase